MDYPITPVPFTGVTFDDGFWLPRLTTNREVTIPYDFAKCEETGRIDNFAKAAGLLEGPHEGIFYNDSDVFKVVEGAAYSLHLHSDPELDAYLDDLIAKFAGAQEDDGYLYTVRTIDPTRSTPSGRGPRAGRTSRSITSSTTSATCTRRPSPTTRPPASAPCSTWPSEMPS